MELFAADMDKLGFLVEADAWLSVGPDLGGG